MNQEDINTMLSEILEKFIIYMYDEYNPEEFNYEFIIANFIDCEENDTIKLFIFNLFKNSGYFNQFQQEIIYSYFSMYDEENPDYDPNYDEDLNNYKYITTFYTHYCKEDLETDYMTYFINDVIENLQPTFK